MRRLLAGLAAGVVTLSLVALGATAAAPSPVAAPAAAAGACPSGTTSTPDGTGCVPTQ
jgi:hypothetical protein